MQRRVAQANARRQRGYLGTGSFTLVRADAFSISWGRTPSDLVRVVRKNMFAVLRYRTGLAAIAVVAGFALPLGSMLAPLWAGPIGWWPFASYVATGLPGALLAQRMGWEALAGLAVPLTRLLLPVALLVSTATTLAQRGVVWRGTRYALADLRRRMVR